MELVESSLADFVVDRVFVELPHAQGGKRLVVSFLPLEKGQLFEIIGRVPSDADAQAPGDDAAATIEGIRRTLAFLDERTMAVLDAAETRPRFSADGTDGTVRWHSVSEPNQRALLEAINSRSGIPSADREVGERARFLDDGAGTEGGA